MNRTIRGMTLIDVVIGTSITLAIFVALIGILQVTLALSSVAKAQAQALIVAGSQIEYIRSLDYDTIGTVGGIPSGAIPQYATTTSNNVAYVVRTHIEYVDSAGDGLGGSDQNSIRSDYKLAKVDVQYRVRDRVYNTALTSIVVPPGIEEAVGGGTIRAVVVNAAGAAVAGATVRIVNASTSPTIDVTSYSDANGIVSYLGAPTSTQYQVYVSKSGYSSAQTYARAGSNLNPSPGYMTVAYNQISTQTFAIDTLARLGMQTYFPAQLLGYYDTFTTGTDVTLASTTIVSGSIELSTGQTSGTALSTSTSPTALKEWGVASSSVSVSASTTVRLRITDGDGSLLPDSALSGNSTGFTSFPISLSGISTSTYPTLRLSASLSTTQAGLTPQLQSWGISYVRAPVVAPNVSFTLTGDKIIGTTGAGVSLYKTTVSTTTGTNGYRGLDIEYDTYRLGASGYDIVEVCDPPTYSISPNSSSTKTLYVGSSTTHNLLIGLRDNAGAIVANASTTLSRSGYASSTFTSTCGTVYFGNLTSATDYTVTIKKTGYATSTYTNVNVSGQSYLEAEFE